MGIPTLIATNSDPTDVASIEFTSGIDGTYDEYMFVFINVAPRTNSQDFLVQFNAAGASDFDEYITSTTFRTYHYQDDSATGGVNYFFAGDQGQGTAYQMLLDDVTNTSASSLSGVLNLFAPSNTAYAKHFYCRVCGRATGDYMQDFHAAGYINTALAIDEISFKFAAGNMDGVIQMYGIA
jgi:hypothetical protein